MYRQMSVMVLMSVFKKYKDKIFIVSCTLILLEVPTLSGITAFSYFAHHALEFLVKLL